MLERYGPSTNPRATGAEAVMRLIDLIGSDAEADRSGRTAEFGREELQRMRHGWPEILWVHASDEQVADLYSWAAGRVSLATVEELRTWVEEVRRRNGPTVSRRRRKDLRELLDRYGSPRNVPTV